MNDDLIPWLRAQLDADEKRANHTKADCARHGSPGLELIMAERDLVDVAVKRRILDLFDAAGEMRDESAGIAAFGLLAPFDLREQVRGGVIAAMRETLRAVAGILATAYAARPGYQEAWRP